MSDRLVDVEGIGPVYAAKLGEQGLTTTDDLLARGARPSGRAALAADTAIDGALILEWVNHVDLFRIRGVAGQFADLLEEAGVDTVVELARRNADNLTAALSEANAAKNLANRVPSVSEVEDWIAQAKSMPRAVFYDDAAEAPASAPAPVPAPSPVAPSTSTPAPPAPPARPVASQPVAMMAPTPDSDSGSDERGWLAKLMDRIRGRQV